MHFCTTTNHFYSETKVKKHKLTVQSVAAALNIWLAQVCSQVPFGQACDHARQSHPISHDWLKRAQLPALRPAMIVLKNYEANKLIMLHVNYM
jgi:hypothetical protein